MAGEKAPANAPARIHHAAPEVHTFTVLSLSAFSTTDSDEAVIAKAAKIGEIRMPRKGYSTPAATGTPAVL